MPVLASIEDIAVRLGKPKDVISAYAQAMADMDGPESVYADEAESRLTPAAAAALALVFAMSVTPAAEVDAQAADLLDRITITEADRQDLVEKLAYATGLRDKLIREAGRRRVSVKAIASAAKVSTARVYQIRAEAPAS